MQFSATPPFIQCNIGGGIRIDWLVKVEGDCPDVSSVNANKRIDANDNALNNVTFVNFGKQKSVVNEDFALAA